MANVYVQGKINHQTIKNLILAVDGMIFNFTLQATMIKKVNTKKYTCDETNSMKVTNCYNEFYMHKLNCSFPWIEAEHLSYERCGPSQKIKDLVNLANNANIEDEKLMEELKDFGCIIPNFQEIKWSVSSWQKAGMGNLSHANAIGLNFPSSSKVDKVD